MKKVLTLLCVFPVFVAARAQVTDNAIGIRAMVGVEFSYQHAFSDRNRLEGDIGWANRNSYSYWKVSGTYQWTFPIQEGFNWYIGPGCSVGRWRAFESKNDFGGTYFNLAGQIGAEYYFHFPLQVSIDMRPELPLMNGYADFDVSPGISVRYCIP